MSDTAEKDTALIWFALKADPRSIGDLRDLRRNLVTMVEEVERLITMGWTFQYSTHDGPYTDFAARREDMTREQAINFRDEHAPGRMLDWGDEIDL